MMNQVLIKEVKSYLQGWQNTICDALLLQGSTDFKTDHWQYAAGKGGGETRIFNDKVIEKGGVNFSHIHGQKLPTTAMQRYPNLTDTTFEALGVSVVLHPLNPYAPTVHANLRFIFMPSAEQTSPLWWFGGGFDLTPYYAFVEDCEHWQRNAQKACLPFGDEIYPHYKKWCDDYFYLPHRAEARGIGGLFFDDLNSNYFPALNSSGEKWNFNQCFALVRSIGDHFLSGYLPIFTRRKNTPYGKREQDFQCYRRGRYVEFNLLYDRGTHFGLQSGGRTESILMSLPPRVTWQYNWQPEATSPEAELQTKFLVRKDWI